MDSIHSPVRTILKPHTPPPDANEYLADCTPQERAIVMLAIEQLGSSYFMEKSHGYNAWKQNKKKSQESK